MAILMIAAFAFWFPFRYAGIFSMAPGAMMGVGAYSVVIAHVTVGREILAADSARVPAFAAFGALI